MHTIHVNTIYSIPWLILGWKLMTCSLSYTSSCLKEKEKNTLLEPSPMWALKAGPFTPRMITSLLYIESSPPQLRYRSDYSWCALQFVICRLKMPWALLSRMDSQCFIVHRLEKKCSNDIVPLCWIYWNLRTCITKYKRKAKFALEWYSMI